MQKREREREGGNIKPLCNSNLSYELFCNSEKEKKVYQKTKMNQSQDVQSYPL